MGMVSITDLRLTTKSIFSGWQRSPGTPEILDIGQGSAPFGNLAGVFDESPDAQREPAVGTCGVTQRFVYFAGLTGSEKKPPPPQQSCPIFWVDRSFPAPPQLSSKHWPVYIVQLRLTKSTFPLGTAVQISSGRASMMRLNSSCIGVFKQILQ